MEASTGTKRTRPSRKETAIRKELPAVEARAEAQRIAFGPIVFMACWFMQQKGVLDHVFNAGSKGISQADLAQRTGLSAYAITVLTDMGLTAGVFNEVEGRLGLTNVGLMLNNDRMTKANMDFMGDVCYEGMWHLGEALEQGGPAGLKVFGEWPTVYQALKELPQHVRKSWFEFDHFYSDHSFPPALRIVLKEEPKVIMDVGGNTGKWAITCLNADPELRMVVVDLPGQLAEVERNVKAAGHGDRLTTTTADMLDPTSTLPNGADVIWMSQFLDCFSEDEIVSILSKAAAAMGPDTTLFIMETFIDRQRFQAASFCLAATSLYFTAIANGNSRMYRAEAFEPLVTKAGLRVTDMHDDIGQGHSVWRCVKA